MLILSADELQIRPNGEKGVPLRGRNLANRSKSCKSVLPLKGRKTVAGCFSIRESALEMLILRTGELQIRPNGVARTVVGGRREESRLYSVDGQQIRPNGWWMVYF